MTIEYDFNISNRFQYSTYLTYYIFFNFKSASFKVGYLSPFVLFLTLPAENKAKLEGGSPHAMRLVTMGSPREAGLCEM